MNLTKLYPENEYQGIMIDVETDGLSPFENSMTSICLIKFSLFDGCIQNKLHFKFKNRLPNAIADPKTLAWRLENNVNEFERTLREMPIELGLMEIDHFILKEFNDELEPILFANHTEFDVSFLCKYFSFYQLVHPWKHSYVFDVNSIVLGRGFFSKTVHAIVLKSERWNCIKRKYFDGVEKPHDAFYDCVLQTEVLIAATEGE